MEVPPHNCIGYLKTSARFRVARMGDVIIRECMVEKMIHGLP